MTKEKMIRRSFKRLIVKGIKVKVEAKIYASSTKAKHSSGRARPNAGKKVGRIRAFFAKLRNATRRNFQPVSESSELYGSSEDFSVVSEEEITSSEDRENISSLSKKVMVSADGSDIQENISSLSKKVMVSADRSDIQQTPVKPPNDDETITDILKLCESIEMDVQTLDGPWNDFQYQPLPNMDVDKGGLKVVDLTADEEFGAAGAVQPLDPWIPILSEELRLSGEVVMRASTNRDSDRRLEDVLADVDQLHLKRIQSIANKLPSNAVENKAPETGLEKTDIMQVGERIELGEYFVDVVDVLGNGGFSCVYTGKDSQGRSVAIKAQRLDGVNEDKQKRIANELELHQNMLHSHIIQLFAFKREANRIIMIMEKAEGGTLAELLGNVDCLDLECAKKVIRQVASALTYMHQIGIVHSDIKPENILIKKKHPQGKAPKDIGHVWISDFGLAVPVGSTIVGGTFDYIAPEYKSRNKFNTEDATPIEAQLGGVVESSMDMWALGAVFKDMTTPKSLLYLLDEDKTLRPPAKHVQVC